MLLLRAEYLKGPGPMAFSPFAASFYSSDLTRRCLGVGRTARCAGSSDFYHAVLRALLGDGSAAIVARPPEADRGFGRTRRDGSLRLQPSAAARARRLFPSHPARRTRIDLRRAQ